ncbi:uncharacterized protein LOC113789368 isoform X2 [Dermatophagoides pteronyssinus]|uniref:Uncharacterized protein n=2 Tax=Dermatophagoides pteronyssinus TaxID=6956 RepID=A0ABQ8JUY0_DERPT|nr:uncharacterized protein LOC113789368 isoform X2 [Dermatophagoides pteronyssinus]KAH9426418.1 hypothetical protein DERP_010987 [Dermatophagoides pteronyssinus]
MKINFLFTFAIMTILVGTLMIPTTESTLMRGIFGIGRTIYRTSRELRRQQQQHQQIQSRIMNIQQSRLPSLPSLPSISSLTNAGKRIFQRGIFGRLFG